VAIMEFVAADVPLERLIEEVTPLRKCRADDVRWIPGRHFGMAEELAAVSGAPERRSSALLYGWRSLRRVRQAKVEGPGRFTGHPRRRWTNTLILQKPTRGSSACAG
jgi:hypothetical protein